jgi:phage-related protein
MAVSKSELDIIIKVKDEASGAIKGLSGKLGNIGSTVLKGAAIGLGAAAAGMGAVGAAAVSLARDAAPLKGVQDAFTGIAEASGTSMDEMLSALKEGSAGMVTNRDLMTSFNKAAQLVSVDFAKTLPDAMGSLGKVALATGQDMGFLMDSLVTGVGRLSPMILDNLGIQVDMTAAMDEYAESIGKTASELTKTEQQTALMNQVMEKLTANTANMPDVAGSAEQAFVSWSVTMQDMKDRIGLAVLPIITKLMNTLGPIFERVLATVMPHIERFLDLLNQLIGVIMEMGFLSSETQEVLASMFGEEVAAQIMSILEWLVNLKDVIVDFVTNTLVPFVKEHWEALKTALIAIGAILAGAAIVSGILSIVAAVTALLNPITLVIAIIAVLATAWSKNWGGIQDKTKAAIDFIRNIINSALTWIRDFWDQHGEQIMSIVQNIWDTVVSIFEWFISYYQTIFAAFRAAFEGDWETFGKKLREAWDMVWEAIGKILSTAGNKSVIAFFTDTDWRQVGIDVVIGIANGIRAGVAWAVNAIRSVAQAVWNTITGFFASESPSQLMAGLGVDLMRGMAIGITQSANLPATAALGAGAGVAGAITNAQQYSHAGNNVFVQNTASAAFMLDQMRQDEFDEIGRML